MLFPGFVFQVMPVASAHPVAISSRPSLTSTVQLLLSVILLRLTDMVRVACADRELRILFLVGPSSGSDHTAIKDKLNRSIRHVAPRLRNWYNLLE